MEFLDCIAEIYVGAAGAGAAIWVLCEKYAPKLKMKFTGIGIWFLLRFALLYCNALSLILQMTLTSTVDFLFAWSLLQGEYRRKVQTLLLINAIWLAVNVAETKLLFVFGDGRAAIFITQGIGAMPRIVGRIFIGSLYLLTACMLIRQEKQIKLKGNQLLLLGVLGAVLFIGVLLLCSFIDYAALPLPWRWQVIFWGLMFAAIAVLMYLIKSFDKQSRCALENSALKVRISEQEQQAFEEEDYRRMQMLRHDMKRYFVTYLQLLREGQSEFVESDMQQMIGERMVLKRQRYTKDMVFNAVINEKAQRCRERKITFTANVVLETVQDNMEYGIMLSNLLDNAIEAEEDVAEQLRRISLNIRTEGEMLHVIVENYVEEPVLEHNPRLATTKLNAELEHGIGLKSVKRIVSENKGEMEIFDKDKTFVIHICIPM